MAVVAESSQNLREMIDTDAARVRASVVSEGDGEDDAEGITACF